MDHRAGYRAGAGVVQSRDEPAVGASDAGEPARADATRLAIALLTPEAVANGFTAYWVGDQLRLAHHCRKVASIDSPSCALVSWHVRTHRCGTPESAWHVPGAPARQPRRDPTKPAHLAPRRNGVT
jgi:hypothetical protein